MNILCRQRKGSQFYSKEIYLQRAIVDALNYAGALVWRTNAGRIGASYTDRFGRTKKRLIMVGMPGVSDVIGVYKGRFVAIEVKLPNRRNYVTDLQQQFLDNIKDHGGIAFVAIDPEEAVKELIKKYQELL